MIRARTVGLAFVAVFAVSVVASASASAHEWKIGGNPITTATSVKSKSTLELEDTKEKVRVKCSGFDKGTVGPGAGDVVEKVTADEAGTNNTITCSFVARGLCEASPAPTAVAVHLPWKTTIETVGTETRDVITADGAGEPGWAVTCKAPLLGNITDTCTAATGNTAMTNVTGGVNLTFDKNSPKANCSRGGTGTGLVEGPDLVESPGGGVLTFN